jgi:lambda repressor-like predicted transcriptional regulator
VSGERTRLADLAKPRATLKDLARHSGLSYSFVAKVSRGVRRPNPRLRRAVEELFNVPASSVWPEDEG